MTQASPSDGSVPAASSPPTEPGGSGTGLYPWIVMGIVVLGNYLPVINLTVLGVALPAIARELGDTAPLSTEWVVTIYLVAVVLIQPATGWLADRFGRRPTYIAALLAFGAGSVVCMLAPSMWVLIGGRVLQGLGGGALQPIGMATIYELFPPARRGIALGVWGVAVMAAPAVGPPLGGWLVTAASWRWIFVAMVGISVVAVALAALLLRETVSRQQRAFDGRGWVLAAVGVVTLVLVARNASEWGFRTPSTILVAAGAVVAIVWLVWRSLHRADPIIDFRMFAVPAFSVTMAVIWLTTITQFVRLNYLPVELQVVRDMAAQEVGLLLAPAAAGAAAAMPIGGWLADRIGPRVPVTACMAVLTVTTFQLANLSPETSQREILMLMFAQGLGAGGVLMPSTVTAMNALPGRFVAQASAVLWLNRQLAGALGIAVLGAVIVWQLGAIAPEGLGTEAEILHAQEAYNRAFFITFVLLAGTTLLSLALPGRRRMREFQQERAAEHAAQAE